LEADVGDIIKNATEMDPETGQKKFIPLTDGLHGIASGYKGEEEGQRFEGKL